ncbi:MAG: 30S ribosomal protein S6 [Chloroflexi bacterium]|nr:30S ribosomal protein S6 [Chloroflexota bacterium]MBP8056473.1 30S ribosomal protein S6 [Chloroflexota bacterium]
MRDYEVTVIVQPTLEDAQRNLLIERVTNWLKDATDGQADSLKASHWGQRQMAYEINRHKEGYYLFYEAKLDPAKLNDIEKNVRYNEDIIRYLFVRKEA